MSVEAVRKDSIYEYLSPLSKVQGQHMVDKFDGDVLDSNRWTTYNIFGGNTFAMGDGINRGFQITTQVGINNRGGIAFSNIRQYDPFNSSSIEYCRIISGADALIVGGLGFSNPDGGSSSSERSCWRTNRISGFYDLNTSDGATTTATDTTLANDTLDHRHQLYLVNTSNYYSIDGVLRASHATNLPNVRLMPFFMAWTNGASSTVGSIQYCEAFNY